MLVLHSPDWSVSVHSAYYRRFAMVTTVLDGTFDVWPVLRASHRIAVANHYCWAFDTDRLVLLHPSNTPVTPNDDAKHRRANRRNEMVIQLMLQMIPSKKVRMRWNGYCTSTCESNEYLLIGLPGVAVDQYEPLEFCQFG